MDYVKQYEDYNTNYDNIINILSEILEAGEITQGSQERLEEAYVDYNQSYSDTITLFQGKKNTSINERIDKIESIKLNANIKDIVNILTNNGEKTTLYLDEDGVLYIDGEKIPELKQTKLIVDEQNGKIESLVSDGFVEDADGNKVKLKVLYSTLSQTVNGIETNVGTIEGVANDANSKADAAISKASQLKQTMDGFTTKVQSMESTLDITVTGVYNEFYVSTSSTELIGGSWSTTRPSSATTGYIWMRTAARNSKGEITYDDPTCISGIDGKQGPPGEPGKPGEKGDDGVSITNTEIFYFVHTSKTSAPNIYAAGWTKNLPDYVEGKFLWYVTKITYSDRTSTFTTPAYLSSWEAKHESAKAISIANQTAEMFQWIVQKGSTSSSITLTDSLIQAIASSNIQLSAKKILINGLMEGSGWKITDEGELDILDLNVRGNFTCDSLNVDTLISADIPPALSENKTIYVSSGETISQYLDDLPLNLNGFTVEIYLTSNTTENLELRRHVNGPVNIFLCGNTIKGTIRSIYNNAKYSIYGGNSTTDTTMGSIMPYTSYNVGSYYYTTIFSDCPNVNLYNLKVYGDSVNSNSVGVGATQKSKVYMENISFVGCKYNCRTYSMTELYCQSSSGLSTGNSWNAGTGAKIVLYPGQQAGGGNNTFTSGNGQIISTGVTFASSKDSGSNTTTVNPTTTRFETFKPKYADTYRSSVYNNWEGRGKCRQGDWGYGDCNGYWFYGSQFAEVKGKNITKVEIDVTRSSDIGYSASTSHVFQAHTYSGRPSSTPSFYTSCNKTLSLAWGKKGTVTITDSTVLNGIKSGTIKGFGIQSTYDKSHYSALTNGTVRIYYTE
ncbi:hypothetical protein [Intestinibacter bartlettii]|uniref:hypothetical protein n=1 Tax=Intestinibacter bartlettii TaxID=261299 RepID=UPI0026770CCF|nr:hypothetical protein [Intestinibacter bartlettii]